MICFFDCKYTNIFYKLHKIALFTRYNCTKYVKILFLNCTKYGLVVRYRYEVNMNYYVTTMYL